jgi:hypothetical protein
MDKEETKKSIELGDLYAKAQDDLKFNGDKAWETIKLCITLSSMLITVILGLLGAINYFSINFFVKVLLIVALIPFPIMMKMIVDFLSKNFERECSRMYENMTILMKIEDELPERKDLSDSRNFMKETKYIPLKWEKDYISPEGKKNLFPNTEEFVKAMKQEKGKFYSNMRPIFSILRVFSYLLLSITCLIAIIVIAPALCSSQLHFLFKLSALPEGFKINFSV